MKKWGKKQEPNGKRGYQNKPIEVFPFIGFLVVLQERKKKKNFKNKADFMYCFRQISSLVWVILPYFYHKTNILLFFKWE